MSSTRPRSARKPFQPAAAAVTPKASSSRPARSTGRRAAKAVTPSPEPTEDALTEEPEEMEEDEDAEGEEVEEEEEEQAPAGPSRRGGGRGTKTPAKPAPRGKKTRPTPTPAKGRGSRSKVVEPTPDVEEDEDAQEEEEEEEIRPNKRMRARKSVSYKEIPVEQVEEEEDEPEDEQDEEGAEEDAEGEEVEEEDGAGDVPLTPRSRRTPSKNAKEEDKDDPSFRREKVGSGRGGFSVKGAAAAAARARWAKVRREKAERGEESDEGEKKSRNTGRGGRRERNNAADSYAMDSTVNIKGVDYTVGDDELLLPDDVKGEAKIDAEGRLLGGREYKVFTFTSESRRNPNRVYALTIDAARACGYSDSLAFLRRCPQILKLACTADERSMLIDIGRVTGNLKHRMVTMVAMRNIYKTMGARVVKNGRWVTDDYYEDESLAKCAENNFTPHAIATEDDIIANALSTAQPQGRPATTALGDWGMSTSRSAFSLTPWYQPGGITTHFAGNGIDPWSEVGGGHKRARLRNLGFTEEDWMLRSAEEARAVDARLKEYRNERLIPLEGKDMMPWMWAVQQKSEQGKIEDISMEIDPALMDPSLVDNSASGTPTANLKPPTGFERKRSGLSQEVTFAKDEAMTPAQQLDQVDEEPEEGDVSMELSEAGPAVDKTEGGKIIVETVEEMEARARVRIAKDWEAGTVYASYEPHTHMPHIPQFTQPTSSFTAKLSHYPIISSQSDGDHINFVQSTITGKPAMSFASVEYVYEHVPPVPAYNASDPYIPRAGAEEQRIREKQIQDALEWEQRSRRRPAIAA